MMSVLEGQKILAEKYGVSSDVWSVTSYNELRRDAQECKRWNMFHPTTTPRKSYVETVTEGCEGPFIASSDYVQAHSEQIAQFLPNDFLALGTDGMGRSETREVLRRHFEVDAECVVIASLYQLSKQGKFKPADVEKAIKDLGVNPEKISPLYA